MNPSDLPLAPNFSIPQPHTFDPYVQPLLFTPSTSNGYVQQLRCALQLTQYVYKLIAANAALKTAFDAVRTAHRTRLSYTHQRALNDSSTRALCTFFFDQLYPIVPPQWRTHQLERALPSISSVMPAMAQRTICSALVLEALCTLSDLNSTQACLLPIAAPVDTPFSPQNCLSHPFWSHYQPLYTSTTEQLRLYQLRRLHTLSSDLLECSNSFMIQGTLRVMRAPAKALGVESLHTFLEQGMGLLRTAPNPKQFVDSIVLHEQTLCQQLFTTSLS